MIQEPETPRAVDTLVEGWLRQARPPVTGSLECGDAGLAPLTVPDALPVGMLGFLAEPLDELLELLEVEVGAVWVMERQSRALVLAVARGLPEVVAEALQTRHSGRDAIGMVAITGRPVTLTRLSLEDSCSDVAALAGGGVLALAAAPLRSRRQIRGVLLVGSRRQPLPAEIETVLLAAGTQLAVAVENAWLHQDRSDTVSGIEQLHESLSTERIALQRTLAAHERLTGILLGGGGLDPIAEALGAMVECPVLVSDAHGAVLASWCDARGADDHFGECVRTGKLGGTTPPPALAHSAGSAGARVSVLAAAPEAGMEWPCAVAPVSAAGHVLGHVWVVQRERHLGEIDYVVLEQTARVVALALMRERAVLEVETRLRGEFAEGLLSGERDARELTREAALIGFDLDRRRTVMVVAFAPQPSAPPAPLLHGLFEVVRAMARAVTPDALVAYRSDGIVLIADAGDLLPGHDPPAQRTRRLAQHIVDEANARVPGYAVSVALGGVCAQPRDYPQVHRRALKALRIARSLGQAAPVVDVDDLSIYEVLYDTQSPELLASVVERALGPLRQYDTAHGTDLVRTLEVYLDHGGSLRQAAETLMVHPNTVEYRLQRMSDLCGWDLRVPEQRFQVQLALRLERLSPAH